MHKSYGYRRWFIAGFNKILLVKMLIYAKKLHCIDKFWYSGEHWIVSGYLLDVARMLRQSCPDTINFVYYMDFLSENILDVNFNSIFVI